MKSLWHWLRDTITETAARSVAFIVVGALGATAVGILSYGVGRFFAQQVQVSVALLTILSLFALVGLLAGAIPLWRLAFTRHRQTGSLAVDERLETVTMAILRRLAEIEAGKQLWVDREITDFRAETLALFDAWESQAQRYLSVEERDLSSKLHDEISSRSLHHSKIEAKGWTKRVKVLTDTARANVS